ncbi:hypothetical protein PRK78_006403 [Emydomyces testavorans]|uniref:Uncharacterized protein n=1 Tax=Emydomyces testavorans TaxID=2070801 RepID=A0AAF0DLC5_9EURO|nr:hypothetical protein PRK78_006403 [Emydomyces testavorans]
MYATVSAARSRPPAPIVEDEVESLLHEVFEDGSAVNVKQDDVPVLSKGSADQFPILIPVEVTEPFPALAESNVNKECNVEIKVTQVKTETLTSPGTPRRTSSTSSSKSRKKANRVRFVEPEGDDKKWKGQPGLDPSVPQVHGPMTDVLGDVEYLPLPSKYNADLSDDQGYDAYQRSSRFERNQEPRASRRHSRRPPGDFDDVEDRQHTSRPLSWNTWDAERGGDTARTRERAPEWHSDDEISSYRGTHYKQWREPSQIVTGRVPREASPVRSSSQRLNTTNRCIAGPGSRVSNDTVSSSTRRRSSTLNGAINLTTRYDKKGRETNDSSRRERSRPPTSRGASNSLSTRRNDGAHYPVDSHAFTLSPCPRSIAMTSYRDWYTIIGLTHLDICPSCVMQLETTRFRHLLIPSIPKPIDTKVRCSLSQPWARLALVQTMKLGLNHLELLYQVTQPLSSCQPCPGRVPSLQPWYRPLDFETGRTAPDFNACSACFRNLCILMPSLRESFQPSPHVQERICDLRTDSTRFIQYLDLLDSAVTRSYDNPRRYIDLRDFIRYAKRKSMIYDCPRDHVVVGAWHYIPELPEFTICEDCYDDVVWPVSNEPIANRISRSLQPVRGPDVARGGRPASCYLSSPRMRTKFREAVRLGDFGYLRSVVLRRYDAETRFRERKRLLLEDVARGYDRDMELRRNAEEWKRSE